MGAGSGFNQSADVVTPIAALAARVTHLEDNEYKITYFESVSSAAGSITKPTGSTILLDQFAGGVDAYVSTIENGQPTGIFPQTAALAEVDVTSFDALGAYTLSGTPEPFPVAIIYRIQISALDYSNLDINKILDLEVVTFGYKSGDVPQIGTDLSASQFLITDSNKKLASPGTVTYPSLTELSYVKNVTSAIQTQLDAKLAKASNLSDLTNAATARTNLGVAYGTTSGTVYEGNRIQTAVMTATQTTSSATLANVTQLVLPLEANKTYILNAEFFISGTAAAGIRLAWVFPTGTTVNLNETGSNTDQVSRVSGRILASDGFGPPLSTLNDATPVGFGRVTGVFSTTNAGNLQVQFRVLTDTQIKTLDIGTYMYTIKTN